MNRIGYVMAESKSSGSDSTDSDDNACSSDPVNYELSCFKSIFDKLDHDHDGVISAEDLRINLTSFGLFVSNAELHDIIKEFDKKDNDRIDLEEFMAVMKPRDLQLSDQDHVDREHELRETFRVFDRDQTGLISPADLRHQIEAVGDKVHERDLKQWMKIYDKDGDGFLNYSEFKEVFESFDRDHDGIISVIELRHAMLQLGQPSSEDELRGLLEESNFRNVDEIRFEDFLKFLKKKLREPDAEEEMKNAFRIFDRSGTGLIKAKDVKLVMNNMGERMTDEEADEMIRLADLNGNGYVNYDDFVQLMMPK